MSIRPIQLIKKINSAKLLHFVWILLEQTFIIEKATSPSLIVSPSAENFLKTFFMKSKYFCAADATNEWAN